MDIETKGSSTALSRRIVRNVPETWGRSELTQFFDLAEQQIHASVAGLPQWVKVLERIDRNLTVNSEAFFHEIDKARYEASRLFMRAFGTYRAACRLALSGQIYEATVLTRSILESAMYAFACGSSKEHREAWKTRGDSDAQRAVAIRLFKWVGLRKLLASKDPALEKELNEFYGDTIELGAHPDVDGIMLSSEDLAEGGKTKMSTIYLHGPDAIVIGILDLLRAMSLTYRLLFHTIGNRLLLLGIDEEVRKSAQATLDALNVLQGKLKEEGKIT
jgi:hypothetical protein